MTALPGFRFLLRWDRDAEQGWYWLSEWPILRAPEPRSYWNRPQPRADETGRVVLEPLPMVPEHKPEPDTLPEPIVAMPCYPVTWSIGDAMALD